MEPPTFREITKRLEDEGWMPVRQKGSHIRYRKGNLTVTIAGSPGDHPTWATWSSIRRQAGW